MSSKLFFYNAEKKVCDVPLVDIRYDIHVSEDAYENIYIQEYFNPNDFPIETYYKYPVYTEASLTGVTAKTDDYEINCVVKEKEDAKKEYNNAIKEGNQAVLVSETNEEMYDIKIGNIKPKQKITIIMKYLCELKYDLQQGGYKLILPTTITPKYDPNIGSLSMNGNENASLLNNLTNIVNITSNGTNDNGIENLSVNVKKEHKCVSSASYADMTSYKISKIDLAFTMATEIDDVICISHDNKIMKNDDIILTKENGFTKNNKFYTINDIIPNKDIIILVKTTLNSSYAFRDGNLLKVHINLPKIQNEITKNENRDKTPMENIFVLDQSGSMYNGYGENSQINVAADIVKNLIFNLLHDVDYFNFYNFGTSFNKVFGKSEIVNISSICKAVNYIDTQKQNNLGGTNTFDVLKAILSNPHIPNTQRNIVLITDGEVGNSDEIIKLCKSDGLTRVFVIGIGDGVSHQIIDVLARETNGESMIVTLANIDTEKQNILGKSIELLLHLSIKPLDFVISANDKNLLNEKRISFVNFNKYFEVEDVFEKVDMYVGNFHITLPVIYVKENNMEKFYNKTLINTLESSCYYGDDKNKSKLIELSKKFNILTRYTSFIGVKTLNEKQSGTQSVEIPLCQAQKYQQPYIVLSTTCSTSTMTGAVHICGGIGVAKNVYIGGNVSDTIDTSSTSTGAVQIYGGIGVGSDVYIGGNMNVVGTSTIDTSSTISGALVINGGVGIGNDVYIGGTSTMQCTLSNTGSIRINGGIGIGKNYCTEVSNGSFKVIGGATFTKEFIFPKYLCSIDSTESVSGACLNHDIYLGNKSDTSGILTQCKGTSVFDNQLINVLKYLIRVNYMIVRIIPEDMWTEELAEFIVDLNGNALEYVPDKFKTQKVCEIAAKHNERNYQK